MAASIITVRASPLDIAHAAAAAMPVEVSSKPLLGILGVVTGAGVVTLTSRMISLGMPDFRGLHGFGYDESAWITSAFDAGLMFVGPFTVYLGRSEEHTSELQSQFHLVCRLLLEKKK